MIIENQSEITTRMEIDEKKAEIADLLSKYGWKWAVMASTVGNIYSMGGSISNGVLNKLKITKTKLESGCYSPCETACDLQEIEKELFPELTKLGPYETDKFLELSSKALNGELTERELDLTGAQPILSDCVTLPCVCR